MSPRFKLFLQRWAISTFAVLVAEHIVSGIRYDSWIDLLVATLVLGILNVFLKPLLMILSLPILILTLGLFTLIINAILLLLVGKLVSGFYVDGFGAAFWGALVISITTIILNYITGINKMEFKISSGRVKNDNDDIIDI